MEKKIKAAVIGYGNIGKYAVEAVSEAEDMILTGVVPSRNPNKPIPHELKNVPVATGIESLIEQYGKPDVALLCTATLDIEKNAEQILSMGINTVDSFDIHSKIFDLRMKLDSVAKKYGSAAICSAGWDPGSDSLIRALLLACAPRGITYTNFGPGMSMGHSVAAKSIKGVKDAMSVTIPLGSSVHRRMVYVQLEDGIDLADVESAIKNDPYFVRDDTRVILTEDVRAIKDTGSGVNMVRKGVAGGADNQQFAFDMRVNNPALT
ncbi:MAG: diaminopimelate dehydrogenase, partial [Defluviitaleaceae bacterium]|nr:diaminopimelate dehydrogenase [Defluviitaleaceae bacterium]